MSEVTLTDVEKVYPNGFKAVHGINLQIKNGEFIVLIGPSGCAKSTTLRMIAGLETITNGEIRIGGTVINNLPPYERGIAMVFQNYALYPHMRVKKNLSFGLRLARHPKEKIETAVKDVSLELAIEQLLKRYPKELSGGQAQRVAVGRALIKKPLVFLFDEPLSNLDAKLRASMRVRITDLHRRLKSQGLNCTVIYVTHDQTEAMTMGDRICVLDEGNIRQVDTPDRLYDFPTNTFVAGFLGSPEMNLHPARLVKKNGQCHLKISEFLLKLPDSKSQALLDHKSDEVIFGLRPPFIQLVPTNTEGTVVDGTIKWIEFMGHEVFIYFLLGNHQYTAVNRIHDRDIYRTLKSGEKVRFCFDINRSHVFDKITGENLTLPKNLKQKEAKK
jgi:oligogalacturonide transport system ATP-binding protein